MAMPTWSRPGAGCARRCSKPAVRPGRPARAAAGLRARAPGEGASPSPPPSPEALASHAKAPPRAARHQLRRTRTAARVAAERLGAAPGRILAMETPRRPKKPQGDARGWLRRDPVSHAHEAAAAARREAREGAPRGPRPWEMAHTLARAHDTATCASLHRASAQGRSTDRRTASPPGPLGPRGRMRSNARERRYRSVEARGTAAQWLAPSG